MGSSFGKLTPPSRETSRRKYQSDLLFFQHSTSDGYYIWNSIKRSNTFYNYREKNFMAVAVLKLRKGALIQLKQKKKFAKTQSPLNQLLHIRLNGFTERLPRNNSFAIYHSLATLYD